jgi:hypothetical protein
MFLRHAAHCWQGVIAHVGRSPVGWGSGRLRFWRRVRRLGLSVFLVFYSDSTPFSRGAKTSTPSAALQFCPTTSEQHGHRRGLQVQFSHCCSCGSQYSACVTSGVSNSNMPVGIRPHLRFGTSHPCSSPRDGVVLAVPRRRWWVSGWLAGR